MAPNTSIGAAHPVSIGGSPTGGEEKPDETMKQKGENYAVAFIETVAAKRKRKAGSTTAPVTRAGEKMPQLVLQHLLDDPLETLYDEIDLDAYPHNVGNHAGLCGELGTMWEKGYGVPKDRKKADEYYRLACDQALMWRSLPIRSLRTSSAASRKVREDLCCVPN